MAITIPDTAPMDKPPVKMVKSISPLSFTLYIPECAGKMFFYFSLINNCHFTQFSVWNTKYMAKARPNL